MYLKCILGSKGTTNAIRGQVLSLGLLKKNIVQPFSIGINNTVNVRRVHASKQGTSQDSGGLVIDESIQPVKIAYSSYESTNPTEISSANPIIIMHGLLGSKANWNSLSKAIHSKTKRKVIAVDARNHGDSTHAPEMTYHHLAEDVKELMKDLNLKKAALIGHSMGGRALMLMSLKYPELVEKLIVVDISPIGTSPSMHHMPKYFDAMDAVHIEPKTSISRARQSANEQLAKAIPDLGVRQFILSTNLVEAENGLYKWRLDLFSIAKNFINIATFPDLGGKVFTDPTLFIAGGVSDFIKTDDHEKIRAIFPNALFEVIPGAGHWVHAEKPNEFVEIVTKFLQTTKKA